MLNCDFEVKVFAKIAKNITCKRTVNIMSRFVAAAVMSIMAIGAIEARAQPISNHNSPAPEILSLDPQRFGTSFDCSRSGRGIPTVVCSDPDLRRADLAQMQRYYTLRHAAQSRQQDLSVIYRSRIQSLVTACSAETVISTRTEKSCVRRGLEEMRAAWLSEIQNLGNTAALDESRLGLEMMISIQQSLANIGFIPMTSVIDGIFGNATRDAIIRFQTDRGIPANGFATPPTHQALTGASLPPAAQGSSGNAVPHRQPSLDVRGDTGQPPPTAPELWTYQNRGGQDMFLLPPGAAPRPTPQSSPAAASMDLGFWQAIQDSRNATDFDAYLAQFPEGRFAPLARTRAAELRVAALPTPQPAPRESAESLYQRGRDHELGRGVPQSDVEAVRLYRLAADQGNASAQNNLGFMHQNGQGVPQNDVEAVRLYRLAANQGNASAQSNLGFMHYDGRGVPQSDVEAVRLFRLAADQGNAYAQNNLGFMHQNGRGVPQNDVEAVRLYRLAADQGDASAQGNLGSMYYDGRGVPQNDVEAVRLFRLAADQGNDAAQSYLGFMHQNGRGVPQNDVEAVRLFRLAARQGNQTARDNLKSRRLTW